MPKPPDWVKSLQGSRHLRELDKVTVEQAGCWKGRESTHCASYIDAMGKRASYLQKRCALSGGDGRGRATPDELEPGWRDAQRRGSVSPARSVGPKPQRITLGGL